MTTIAIVGGRLQGTEAAYLAGRAGFQSLLIDADPLAPARKICDRFLSIDVIKYTRQFLDAIAEADLVLPALENREVLAHLTALAEVHGFPLGFDLHAYDITASKIISDQRMAAADIPVPRYYPDAELPLIAKPSQMSGSLGVKKLVNQCDLLNILPEISGGNWVLQEYLSGPSYSIEIIGRPGAYGTYHITELFMDPAYDCKRVLSTPTLSKETKAEFQDIAIKLGNMVQLKGIMDVEVICDKGKLKVLEIDARLPSQTPSVVYHATGVNLIEELYHLFCGDFSAPRREFAPRYVVYEHLLVRDGEAFVLGEHVLAGHCLMRRPGFLSAADALTDWEPGKREWVVTLVHTADDETKLRRRQAESYQAISRLQGQAVRVFDEGPPES